MERLKELSAFAGSFDHNQMNTVHQWIKKFGWNREDEDRIKTLLDNYLQHKRELSIALSKNRSGPAPTRLRKKELQKEVDKILPGKVEMEVRQNEAKLPIIGFCPRCGSTLGGQPCGGCKKLKFDRVFMKECSSCDYYSEIFRRGNKHFEVEGG